MYPHIYTRIYRYIYQLILLDLLSQLCQAYLLNIPGWDWRRDDQAVCLNEVKYGLLAQVKED